MAGRRNTVAVRLAAVAALGLGSAVVPAVAGPAAAAPGAASSSVAYPHLALPNGRWARVFADGLAEIHDRDTTRTEMVQLPLVGVDGAASTIDPAARQLPGKGELIMDLVNSGRQQYASGQVVVIYRDAASAGPAALLDRLGVDRTHRLFRGGTRGKLASMRDTAQNAVGHAVLDFPDAVVLHVHGASVPSAVDALRANPDVAYAAPNWMVATSHTPGVPLQQAAARAATSRQQTASLAAAGLPANYALTSSAQSMLNRPANDVVPAYSAIAAHGELPGQGEIITNVSLGDLTDASAAADTNDPCNFYAANYGPTTVVQNGQRYIDWPSMPLIPTYTSDANGNLDPTGETCGQDPNLVEVGLDFSMMAPLPHDQQRPGAVGAGLTDLLGIAPGAQYRLVIPGTAGGSITDVDAAFLAAATQTPKPDVITASLAFGLDADGFPSRYLEDDPLSAAVVTSIVHGAGIVVCLSSNDGLRTATNAPVPPSGGSVDTDVAPRGKAVTDLNDVAFSSAPSLVRDSGAIDVGGSTLNDIFAAPPGDPANAALKAQQAFPATRYDGARNYSSGIGSRVNVSAPGDNVVSLAHPFGGAASDVQVLNEGGTSASAPEAAAAAAVVMQVARLTHNVKLQTDPLAVRDFLERTGTPLPDVPQSDLPLNVGPQIDLGNAVETLFGRSGDTAHPGVARVAVVQRQQASALGGTIQTATDPTNISLAGRLVDAWLTISPDWVGVPRSGVSYRLSVGTGVLARAPWARLQPKEILTAAGLPVVSATARTVSLTYTASIRGAVVASTAVPLTFGPTDGSRPSVPAPLVPAVEHGSTVPVSYDITGLTGASNPTLVVSQPGRVESATGLFFRPSFTTPLTAPTGTVNVPVSALPGAGIYGVGIQDAPGGWLSRNDSAFAFTRIAPTGDAQPPVPLVSAGAAAPGHYAEFPYGGTFRVSYDVRPVASANGAIIEISAPGPTPFRSYNTFNNPNGSQRDANGHDTGSVAYLSEPTTHGTVTLDGNAVGLDPTMNHVLRVLATRSGKVVGEASGVSTISMDGVRPADGGNVANGFGVNANGSDGFVTSDQATADGTIIGSVESFAQGTGAITSTPLSSDHIYGTMSGACPGLFHGDVGLIDDFDPATQQDVFRVLNPVASGDDGGTWSPPAELGPPLCVAQNQDTSQTAVLTGQGGTAPTLEVVASDIGADTFGTPIALAPAMDPNALSIAGGIGQDTELDQAFVPVVDAFAPNSPGRIVTADLATGAVSSFPSVTDYFPSGIAVDSTTHTGIVSSNDDYGIYDLANRTAHVASSGGGGYQHVAADSTHHLFVLQEVSPPDSTGSNPNNNAMSAIDVVDETGALVERIEAFNFFNIYLLDMGSYVQLNPSTGTGFTLAPGGWQLFPFHYSVGG